MNVLPTITCKVMGPVFTLNVSSGSLSKILDVISR